jgi:hypothetical protein
MWTLLVERYHRRGHLAVLVSVRSAYVAISKIGPRWTARMGVWPQEEGPSRYPSCVIQSRT